MAKKSDSSTKEMKKKKDPKETLEQIEKKKKADAIPESESADAVNRAVNKEEVKEALKRPMVGVRCSCGNTLGINVPNWEINIVGILQFKCKLCGLVQNIPDNFWK